MSHTHAPGDKPALASIEAGIEHDYLVRDLEALIDAYGLPLFKIALQAALTERCPGLVLTVGSLRDATKRRTPAQGA